jgi:predicted heme/steroid binding protein
MFMNYEQAVYDKAEALDTWKYDAKPKSQFPKGAKYLGDTNDVSAFDAFVFEHKGVAYVHIGCRVFNLSDAKVWWTAGRTAASDARYSATRSSTEAAARELRAGYILRTLLPAAERWAKRRKLKVR